MQREIIRLINEKSKEKEKTREELALSRRNLEEHKNVFEELKKSQYENSFQIMQTSKLSL